MTDLVAWLPCAVVLFLIAGSLVRGRLDEAVQPLRLELADKGERLLASPDVPQEMKETLRYMLKSTFGCGFCFFVTAVALPFILLSCAFNPKSFRSFVRDVSKLEPETRAAYDDCTTLFHRIKLANHPVLQSVMTAEYAIFTPIILLGIAIRRDPIPVAIDSNAVMGKFELKHLRAAH